MQPEPEADAIMPQPEATESRGPFSPAAACGHRLKRFGAAESGAVSADYVVLSALVILFAVSVVATMQDAVIGVGPKIGDSLESAEIDLTWPE